MADSRPPRSGMALIAAFVIMISALAAGALPGDGPTETVTGSEAIGSEATADTLAQPASSHAHAPAPVALAAPATAGEAASVAGDITPTSIADGTNSADAGRLLDGQVGDGEAASWSNSGNPWTDASYPMDAVVDLGAAYQLSSVTYFAGQIPFPEQAALQFEVSATGEAASFTPLAVATAPAYNQWSESLPTTNAPVRYVRVGFASMQARFHLAELAFEGSAVDPVDPIDPVDPGVGSGFGDRIENVIVDDGMNSKNAFRLVDRVQPPGTHSGAAWEHPTPWDANAYPMTAEFDLGGDYNLSGLAYFIGNISQGTDRISFEYSTSASGENFSVLASITDGHTWNAWREVALNGQSARRIRIRFDSPQERFNVSEVVFFASSATPPPTTTPPTTGPVTTTPPTTSPATTNPATTQPPTTTPGTAPPSTQPPITQPPSTQPPNSSQPQAGPPPANVVRSHGFGNWPGDHLTQSCRDAHDSYWVQGPNAGISNDPNHPENKAYPTWHPAVIVTAAGERCDIGHEHGFDPSLAPQDVFDLSGGFPAFGYVAETMSGHRHEDHVGHKVTVAHFRAAIGNGAGSEPLYDAGFECDWLSKIHQGSSTLDAFANHLHEYFLTLRCMDGLNAQGVVDNTVVGTQFSVKVMYTYGEPNKFAEDGCSRDNPATPQDETVFSYSILTGPEGQAIPPAHQTSPLGNDSPNNRGFTCSSGVIWKDLSEVSSVDLWTQLIKLKNGDDDTIITIQPYYIVKNPSRIVEAYDGFGGEQPKNVVRTISLCYDDAGNRLQRDFCDGAPASEPDWRSPTSPFNGALRAVNFKSSHVQNAGGDSEYCTDPFGFKVNDPVPCEQGNILQKVAPFDNHWNDGRYSYNGRTGNIQGSIWARDPFNNLFQATPAGGGAYTPNGIGFEFIVDNRNPDDDRDGLPDGANLRGQN